MDANYMYSLHLQMNADLEAMLALAHLLQHKTKRRHPRWWVRPWLSDERRLQCGQYNTLMKELREEDEDSFKNYLRITPAMFDTILQRISPPGMVQVNAEITAAKGSR